MTLADLERMRAEIRKPPEPSPYVFFVPRELYERAAAEGIELPDYVQPHSLLADSIVRLPAKRGAKA